MIWSLPSLSLPLSLASTHSHFCCFWDRPGLILFQGFCDHYFLLGKLFSWVFPCIILLHHSLFYSIPLNESCFPWLPISIYLLILLILIIFPHSTYYIWKLCYFSFFFFYCWSPLWNVSTKMAETWLLYLDQYLTHSGLPISISLLNKII